MPRICSEVALFYNYKLLTKDDLYNANTSNLLLCNIICSLSALYSFNTSRRRQPFAFNFLFADESTHYKCSSRKV